jgi:hypothetical protein
MLSFVTSFLIRDQECSVTLEERESSKSKHLRAWGSKAKGVLTSETPGL